MLLPMFGENVYSESPSYILNTHPVSIYNNSLYIPHKASSSVQPSVCWAIFSLIISKVRVENFATGLHFTISLTPFIFLPARRKIGGGRMCFMIYAGTESGLKRHILD